MKVKLKDITFEQFNEWANLRAADGGWSMRDAITAVNAIGEYHKQVHWYTFKNKKNLIWNEIKEKYFNLESEIEI